MDVYLHAKLVDAQVIQLAIVVCKEATRQEYKMDLKLKFAVNSKKQYFKNIYCDNFIHDI